MDCAWVVVTETDDVVVVGACVVVWDVVVTGAGVVVVRAVVDVVVVDAELHPAASINTTSRAIKLIEKNLLILKLCTVVESFRLFKFVFVSSLFFQSIYTSGVIS